MSMTPEQALHVTRRQFFGLSSAGIGAAALGSLMSPSAFASVANVHATPRAKRVIYLFQSGGPSQLDLFDYKPQLKSRQGEDLPDTVRMGQRLTGMTSGQDAFPTASSIFKFAQHGESGTWVSDWLPYTAGCVDDIAVIRSCWTNGINHSGGVCQMNTGTPLAGRPSLGAWVSY